MTAPSSTRYYADVFWASNGSAEGFGVATGADDLHVAIARLDGFLKAFEWFNHKTNHQCNYFVLPLPNAASVPEALAARFDLSPAAFRVEALVDADGELRAVFAQFLLLFQELHGDHLTDQRCSFSLSHDFGRDALLNELAEVVRSLGTRAAWRVVPLQECGELREWCFQDDVVLELPDRRCLLHFGVSD